LVEKTAVGTVYVDTVVVGEVNLEYEVVK